MGKNGAKWNDQYRKHLLLLWIRDATRPVKFFRIHTKLLWVTFVMILFLLIASVCYHISTDRFNHAEIERLQERQRQEYERYLQDILHKDAYISELQHQLFHFQQQLEPVQRKLKQLEQLEYDVQQLLSAGFDTTIDPIELSHKTKLDNDVLNKINAIGGIYQEPELEHWETLIADTNEQLHQLRLDMDDIFSQFTEMKQVLLEHEHQKRYTPSIWPSDSRTITSGYGIRIDPFNGNPNFHNGIDFAGNVGDPIYATADGTVSETGSDNQKGNYILLEHEYGWSTMYMHLSKVEVKKGDIITKGQQIGKMGSTGRSTGPHLHYEVWQDGKPVNPQYYLPE